MSRKLKWWAFIVPLFAIACEPVAAQGICAQRDIIVEGLASRYGEAPVSRGLTGSAEATNIIEVFASSNSGNWTIVRTEPSGITCVLAAGQGWEAIVPEPAGDGT